MIQSRQNIMDSCSRLDEVQRENVKLKK